MVLNFLAKPHNFTGLLILTFTGAGLHAVPYILGMSRLDDVITISYMDLFGTLAGVYAIGVCSWVLGMWWIQRQKCKCGAPVIHSCDSERAAA